MLVNRLNCAALWLTLLATALVACADDDGDGAVAFVGTSDAGRSDALDAARADAAGDARDARGDVLLPAPDVRPVDTRPNLDTLPASDTRPSSDTTPQVFDTLPTVDVQQPVVDTLPPVDTQGPVIVDSRPPADVQGPVTDTRPPADTLQPVVDTRPAEPDATFNLPDATAIADVGVPDAIAAPDAAPTEDTAVGSDALVVAPDAGAPGDNLLANAGFSSSDTSWTADINASQAWEASRDAAGSSTSGSLKVANANVLSLPGLTMGGSRQCVPVLAGSTYSFNAKVFIDAGQEAGWGGIAVQHFASANCSGVPLGVSPATQTAATGSWQTLAGTTTTPAGAASMAVRLVAIKPFQSAAFQVFFDDISLSRQ
jgi:hypothetical protein